MVDKDKALVQAKEEIESVLKKHDLFGMACFCNRIDKGQTFHFPAWSDITCLGSNSTNTLVKMAMSIPDSKEGIDRLANTGQACAAMYVCSTDMRDVFGRLIKEIQRFLDLDIMDVEISDSPNIVEVTDQFH